ncbi:MAG: hypothetical protein A3B30_03370 [Candidatus Komeilibacteria bacterium RIFCSPLOWO2_01_FULL_52_15]|uniref:Glycosyltransferase 2-like domain-containing protein n=2 Tax=Candidatus Komeiliibacteriota TaxID=1817908 RepID=A0A1G2BPL1_9BACT|nr:MAG: hypothetical protein A2677_00565 [Candidatus Komeilibacteria bacterium RIFCSPHIGHO2_01_FULL_52_14]OGY91054.1 MAG: hypothetical protein A3B30_03370 [Candidatus Komeilibacteria bacterium RIFCSPLOWO2_01_FULL_52_15]
MTLVVIPTYNEKETIGALLQALQKTLSCHILVVDDASPDGTGQLLEAYREKNPSVYCLHRPKKLGLGSAYRDGFQWALAKNYDPVVQMDADGSHDVRYLDDFITRSTQCDLVIGSRYVDGGGVVVSWGLHRRLMSSAGNRYINTILQMKDRRYQIRDSTGGFKCWRAATLRAIGVEKVQADGYAFQVEMNWHAIRMGAKVCEAPIVFQDRIGGRSKIARSGILQTALLPFRLQ